MSKPPCVMQHGRAAGRGLPTSLGVCGEGNLNQSKGLFRVDETTNIDEEEAVEFLLTSAAGIGGTTTAVNTNSPTASAAAAAAASLGVAGVVGDGAKLPSSLKRLSEYQAPRRSTPSATSVSQLNFISEDQSDALRGHISSFLQKLMDAFEQAAMGCVVQQQMMLAAQQGAPSAAGGGEGTPHHENNSTGASTGGGTASSALQIIQEQASAATDSDIFSSASFPSPSITAALAANAFAASPTAATQSAGMLTAGGTSGVVYSLAQRVPSQAMQCQQRLQGSPNVNHGAAAPISPNSPFAVFCASLAPQLLKSPLLLPNPQQGGINGGGVAPQRLSATGAPLVTNLPPQHLQQQQQDSTTIAASTTNRSSLWGTCIEASNALTTSSPHPPVTDGHSHRSLEQLATTRNTSKVRNSFSAGMDPEGDDIGEANGDEGEQRSARCVVEQPLRIVSSTACGGASLPAAGGGTTPPDPEGLMCGSGSGSGVSSTGGPAAIVDRHRSSGSSMLTVTNMPRTSLQSMGSSMLGGYLPLYLTVLLHDMVAAVDELGTAVGYAEGPMSDLSRSMASVVQHVDTLPSFAVNVNAPHSNGLIVEVLPTAKVSRAGGGAHTAAPGSSPRPNAVPSSTPPRMLTMHPPLAGYTNTHPTFRETFSLRSAPSTDTASKSGSGSNQRTTVATSTRSSSARRHRDLHALADHKDSAEFPQLEAIRHLDSDSVSTLDPLQTSAATTLTCSSTTTAPPTNQRPPTSPSSAPHRPVTSFPESCSQQPAPIRLAAARASSTEIVGMNDTDDSTEDDGDESSCGTAAPSVPSPCTAPHPPLPSVSGDPHGSVSSPHQNGHASLHGAALHHHNHHQGSPTTQPPPTATTTGETAHVATTSSTATIASETAAAEHHMLTFIADANGVAVCHNCGSRFSSTAPPHRFSTTLPPIQTNFTTSVASAPLSRSSNPAAVVPHYVPPATLTRHLSGSGAGFTTNSALLPLEDQPSTTTAIGITGGAATFESMARGSLASLPSAPVHFTNSVHETVDDVGIRVINRYMVMDTLGEGACGKVKLAFSMDRNIPVAIKITRRAKYPVNDPLGRGFDAREQALRHEIAIMKKLRHKNIVQLYEVIDDPAAEKMYVVMQYVDRGSVGRVQADGSCTRHDLQTVLSIGRQVAAGLEYLHRHRIVHRDVKPENILWGHDGRVYLSDFGISSYVYRKRGEETFVGLGTPHFMAPELLSALRAGGGEGSASVSVSCQSRPPESTVSPPLPGFHLATVDANSLFVDGAAANGTNAFRDAFGSAADRAGANTDGHPDEEEVLQARHQRGEEAAAIESSRNNTNITIPVEAPRDGVADDLAGSRSAAHASSYGLMQLRTADSFSEVTQPSGEYPPGTITGAVAGWAESLTCIAPQTSQAQGGGGGGGGVTHTVATRGSSAHRHGGSNGQHQTQQQMQRGSLSGTSDRDSGNGGVGGSAAHAYEALDLWSLGVVLFGLLFGRVPFRSTDEIINTDTDGLRRLVEETIADPAYDGLWADLTMTGMTSGSSHTPTQLVSPVLRTLSSLANGFNSTAAAAAASESDMQSQQQQRVHSVVAPSTTVLQAASRLGSGASNPTIEGGGEGRLIAYSASSSATTTPRTGGRPAVVVSALPQLERQGTSGSTISWEPLVVDAKQRLAQVLTSLLSHDPHQRPAAEWARVELKALERLVKSAKASRAQQRAASPSRRLVAAPSLPGYGMPSPPSNAFGASFGLGGQTASASPTAAAATAVALSSSFLLQSGGLRLANTSDGIVASGGGGLVDSYNIPGGSPTVMVDATDVASAIAPAFQPSQDNLPQPISRFLSAAVAMQRSLASSSMN